MDMSLLNVLIKGLSHTNFTSIEYIELCSIRVHFVVYALQVLYNQKSIKQIKYSQPACGTSTCMSACGHALCVLYRTNLQVQNITYITRVL